jgi:hypothetical protein
LGNNLIRAGFHRRGAKDAKNYFWFLIPRLLCELSVLSEASGKDCFLVFFLKPCFKQYVNQQQFNRNGRKREELLLVFKHLPFSVCSVPRAKRAVHPVK